VPSRLLDLLGMCSEMKWTRARVNNYIQVGAIDIGLNDYQVRYITIIDANFKRWISACIIRKCLTRCLLCYEGSRPLNLSPLIVSNLFIDCHCPWALNASEWRSVFALHILKSRLMSHLKNNTNTEPSIYLTKFLSSMLVSRQGHE
jgi:hypothetical protein